MRTEYYIADDGSIHSRTIEDSPEERTDSGHRVNNATSTYHVSSTRKILYWIISMALAYVLGSFLTKLWGAPLSESENAETQHGLCALCFSLAPYVILFGSLFGSAIFGLSYAEESDYNLLAILFSVFAALAGALLFDLLLVVLWVVFKVLYYIFIFILIVIVLVAILGG